MSSTDPDPIRGWLVRRQQAAEDAAMSRALTRATTDLGIGSDDQGDAEQAPNVDNLTAGSQPADYTPPSINDRFRDWVRDSTNRRGPEPPPAA